MEILLCLSCSGLLFPGNLEPFLLFLPVWDGCGLLLIRWSLPVQSTDLGCVAGHVLGMHVDETSVTLWPLLEAGSLSMGTSFLSASVAGCGSCMC